MVAIRPHGYGWKPRLCCFTDVVATGSVAQSKLPPDGSPHVSNDRQKAGLAMLVCTLLAHPDFTRSRGLGSPHNPCT
jgi:hypothetical protein